MDRFRLSILFIVTSFVLSCSNQMENQSSRVSFSLPASMHHQKVGALQTSLAACFAVSIRGENLAKVRPGSCDGEYGLFAGLSPLGGTLQMEVPYGSNRTIDIYYILSNSGCQNFDVTRGLGQTFGSDRVHLISRTPNIDMNQSEVTVEVDIDWPSEVNTLAQSLSAPSTCNKGAPGIDLMAVKQARLVQGAASGSTQNGSLVHIKIVDQNLNIKAADGWSEVILPARLGEEK